MARESFSSIPAGLNYPDFLDIQRQSFADFFQLDTSVDLRKREGLYKVFCEHFPISDTQGKLSLRICRL